MKRSTKHNILILIVLILVTLIFVYLNSSDGIKQTMLEFNQDLINISMKLGIPGALMIAIIGNSTLFFPMPYMIPIILLGSAAPSIPYLVILTLVSALGMTIGEVISYYFGVVTGDIIIEDKDNRLFNRINNILRQNTKIAPLLTFIFAISPLPDDVLILSFGIIKYDVRRIILPMFFGKMGLAAIYTFGGHYFYRWVAELLDYNVYVDSTFFIFIFILCLIVLVMKNVERKDRK